MPIRLTHILLSVNLSLLLQAVKSVLVMAGSLKRGYPDVDEDLTLIRALVDSNVPKFLADDLPLFAAIVKVSYPSISEKPSFE